MINLKNKLFILDLANNHFGDVEHAVTTIRKLAEVLRPLDQNIAIKFQLRDLDSYIHKDFVDRTDLHYIKRFVETRLSVAEFKIIANEARNVGFSIIATVFDEASCQTFKEIGFDAVKVASASSSDFGLLRAVVQLRMPTIVSTGGLNESQVFDLHNFLKGANTDFAIMHCVSIYPSPDEELNLRQISNFKELFVDTPIGWSTHENPENLMPVSIASALGATIFERHVGLGTEKYKLNAYSSTPEIVRDWIESELKTTAIAGSFERMPTSQSETLSLHSLKRGVFAKKSIQKGDSVGFEDLYSAFPLQDGGYEAGTIRLGGISTQNIKADAAITKENISFGGNLSNSGDIDASTYVAQIMKIIRRSRVAINADASLELSHHYGISRFREFGTAMFTCINRNYAKKILIMLPRQKHPLHFHDMKEESFQLLWGDVQVTINGISMKLEIGQIVTVYPKDWHKFTTLNGCVLEEISTHHAGGDSFYEDDSIQSLDVSSRKTHISPWVI